MKLKATLFSVGFVAIGVATSFYGVDRWEERQLMISTENAYVRANIPVISSEIDGYVKQVLVRANDRVKAGDVLVTLAQASYGAIVDAAAGEHRAAEAEVETAEAAVVNMRARRKLQESLIAQAEAQLAAVNAQAENASLERIRQQELLDRGITTRQKFEAALANDQAWQAEVWRAEAELTAAGDEMPVIDSEIRRLQSEIGRYAAKADQAKSRLNKAEMDFSDTVITAPVDGIVANRKVEAGMYMEKGWPMMSIVPIEPIWVTANLKETQLKRVEVGQQVRLEVDAFSDLPLEGWVESIGAASAAEFSLLPPQNATGNFIKVVQRVPVRIFFNEIPEHLKGRIVPGMSVVATIDTRSGADGSTALAVEKAAN